MRHDITICAIAALLLGAGALHAQDLKPVKDKASKKYGYTDADKAWVISPRFDKARKFDEGVAIVAEGDKAGVINTAGEWVIRPEYDGIDDYKKNGLCRLMLKGVNTRLYGVADRDGRVVLPVEFNAVEIDRRNDVIAARRNITMEDTPWYTDRKVLMWGVYAHDGTELVAPQFSAAPSFSNGCAIVTSAVSGLQGVIDLSGNELIPIQNFSIEKKGSKFTALTSDFVWVGYNENFNAVSTEEMRGYVAPFDTRGDDVRAVTFGKLRMGQPLHRNELKIADLSTPRSLRAYDLDIDWGHHDSRFVRLEPVIDPSDGEHDMTDAVSGRSYTICARLYEADGTPVEQICSYGWIEGVCAECVIFNAESKTLWAIMNDINTSGAHSFTTRMTNYRAITSSSIQTVFALSSAEDKAMHSWGMMRDLHQKILREQNAGITSYSIPEAGQADATMFLKRTESWPLLKREYQIGEVISAKVGKAKDGQVLATAGDALTIHFSDRFSGTSLKLDADQDIYWGPNNGRFIKLELIPVKTDKKKLTSIEKADKIYDDSFSSGLAYKLGVYLYEPDGSFVRSLGESVKVAFAPGDMVLLEDLGLILAGPSGRTPHPGQKFNFSTARYATTLSELRTQQVIKPEEPPKK